MNDIWKIPVKCLLFFGVNLKITLGFKIFLCQIILLFFFLKKKGIINQTRAACQLRSILLLFFFFGVDQSEGKERLFC